MWMNHTCSLPCLVNVMPFIPKQRLGGRVLKGGVGGSVPACAIIYSWPLFKETETQLLKFKNKDPHLYQPLLPPSLFHRRSPFWSPFLLHPPHSCHVLFFWDSSNMDWEMINRFTFKLWKEQFVVPRKSRLRPAAITGMKRLRLFLCPKQWRTSRVPMLWYSGFLLMNNICILTGLSQWQLVLKRVANEPH